MIFNQTFLCICLSVSNIHLEGEGGWILLAYFQVVMKIHVSLLVSTNPWGWGEVSLWLLTGVEFLVASMHLGQQVSPRGKNTLLLAHVTSTVPAGRRKGCERWVMMKDLSFHMTSSAIMLKRRDGPFILREGELHIFV